VIKSVMLWNEPDNDAYWTLRDDPEYRILGAMLQYAADEVRSISPDTNIVLGGMSGQSTGLLRTLLDAYGLRSRIDAVGLHGFPYDWSYWPPEDWDIRLADFVSVSRDIPVWITETGCSRYDGLDNQRNALIQSAQLLRYIPHVYWYSLLDHPRDVPAYDAIGPDAGHLYERHYSFGLFHGDPRRDPVTPMPAAFVLPHTWGLVQWFQFQDYATLDCTVKTMRSMGLRKIRTGLSWADWHRPEGPEWLDEVMCSLRDFDVLATLCFAPPSITFPESRTVHPGHIGEFANFARWVADRYCKKNPMSPYGNT
jgi:hypothetical protein